MKEKLLTALIVIASVITLISIFYNPLKETILTLNEIKSQIAAVILSHNFKSVDEIKSNYDEPRKKVRVLIVPGHEPDFGGAVFNGLLERDMNVQLGEELQNLLEKDSSNYKVYITRDSNGWATYFDKYFTDNWDEIIEWVEASKDEFSSFISLGLIPEMRSTIKHNKAPEDVAVRLYGINKWSNENDIDITIHIHFNNDPRRNAKTAGKYSGFSIYVPAEQYGNSATTKAIAEKIFDRLETYSPVSDFLAESVGIVDGSELIALGSYNTADAASLLIEYGYIYEPQFQEEEIRELAIKGLAMQTYLGLQDFFGQK